MKDDADRSRRRAGGVGSYDTEHARLRVRSEHGIRSLKRFTILHL